jgi:hypothetical protein
LPVLVANADETLRYCIAFVGGFAHFLKTLPRSPVGVCHRLGSKVRTCGQTVLPKPFGCILSK